MKQYTLHRIDPFSLFKVGCLVGLISSWLPFCVVVFAGFRIVANLANWLGGMVYRLRLPLPGDFGIDINVVDLLHLQDFYGRISSWAALGFLQILLIATILTFFAAIFWGFIGAISAVFFNLLSKATGGIRVSMAEESVIESNNKPLVEVP